MRHKLLGGAVAMAGCITAKANAPGANSGLAPGEYVTAFNPIHVTGTDKGTATCPV